MRRLALLLAFCSFGLTTGANAQTSVGVHYTALLDEYPRETRSGAGGFFTYTPGVAGLDVSATVFRAGEVGGTAWQLLAGPRVGGVRRNVGIYGRVRPGVIRFSERFFKPQVVCIAIFPPPEACLAPQTNFVLDLGFTLEAFPSPSTGLRFDLGDTLTRYDFGEQGTEWMQGLQFVGGVGVRF